MTRRGAVPVTLRDVSASRPPAPRQLLLYRFAAGARYEGGLVGALERAESGGALRILDALFVGTEMETGELVAVDMSADRGGGLVASFVSVRLDPAARRKATARALDGARGVPPELVRGLAEMLEPGAAVIAVLVEHVWAGTLAEAVARSGGTALENDFVEADTLADAAPALLAAIAA